MTSRIFLLILAIAMLSAASPAAAQETTWVGWVSCAVTFCLIAYENLPGRASSAARKSRENNQGFSTDRGVTSAATRTRQTRKSARTACLLSSGGLGDVFSTLVRRHCISHQEFANIDGPVDAPTVMQGLCMSFRPAMPVRKLCEDSRCLQCEAPREDLPCMSFAKTPGLPISTFEALNGSPLTPLADRDASPILESVQSASSFGEDARHGGRTVWQM